MDKTFELLRDPISRAGAVAAYRQWFCVSDEEQVYDEVVETGRVADYVMID
ncbi:MAG: hypothetical protein ACLP4V_32815 [Methylocella sp.]